MFPYSAGAPRDSTCTSSITSTSGCGAAPPLHGQVKFVPSSRKAFSSTPPPKTETQLLFPLEGEVGETPGAALMKSNMLYRLTGIDFICSEPNRLDSPIFHVSREDADTAT